MNGNSEVSADAMRAAIITADRKAKSKGRPGFTTLEVAAALSTGTHGVRGTILRQVHNYVAGMRRDNGLALSHQAVTFDYYTLADGMTVIL